MAGRPFFFRFFFKKKNNFKMAASQLSEAMQQEIKKLIERPITEEENRAPALQMMNDFNTNYIEKDVAIPKKDPKKLDARLERADANTPCLPISILYIKGKTPPPDQQDMVKWPVPNEQGEVLVNLCFYVREVQEYIRNYEKLDPQTNESQCPMFAPKKIQHVFTHYKLEYQVPKIMDPDFRSVFLTYDLISPAKSLKKQNFLQETVVSYLQEFLHKTTQPVEKPVAPNQNTNSNPPTKWKKVSGFFWYFTEKSIGFLKKGTVMAARALIWIIRNPYYYRMILTVVHAIRILLCIRTSFVNVPNQMTQAALAYLAEYTPGFGVVIIAFVQRALNCAAGLGNVAAGEYLAATNGLASCTFLLPASAMDTIAEITPGWVTDAGRWIGDAMKSFVWTVGNFFKSCLSPITSMVGGPLMNIFAPVMNGVEAGKSNYLGLGFDVTTAENLRRTFSNWNPDYYDFQTWIYFLHGLTFVVDLLGNEATAPFVLTIIGFIPGIGTYLAAALLPLTKNHQVRNSLRWLLVQIRRIYQAYKEITTLIYGTLNEIREWIFDLFPCLLRFMGDKLLSFLTFGYFSNTLVNEGDKISTTLQPTCCLTQLIKDLQRNFVFGELRRQDNIKAQDLEYRRSQMTWTQYLFGTNGGRKELAQIQKEEDEVSESREKVEAKILETGPPIEERFQNPDGPNVVTKLGRALVEPQYPGRSEYWRKRVSPSEISLGMMGDFQGVPNLPSELVSPAPESIPESAVPEAMTGRPDETSDVTLTSTPGYLEQVAQNVGSWWNGPALPKINEPFAVNTQLPSQEEEESKSALEEENLRPTFVYQSFGVPSSTAPINTGRSRPNYLTEITKPNSVVQALQDLGQNVGSWLNPTPEEKSEDWESEIVTPFRPDDESAPTPSSGSWFSSWFPNEPAAAPVVGSAASNAPSPTMFSAPSKTMTITHNIVGIPCVDDTYVVKTQIGDIHEDVMFKGQHLRFYFCADGQDVYWHLKRKEMIDKFAQYLAFGDAKQQNVVLPIDLFDSNHVIHFAKMPTMLVRL